MLLLLLLFDIDININIKDVLLVISAYLFFLIIIYV